ncbi:MAG: UbiD family decarboxylase [Desulfatiglandales bacterium]|nr:UbiD family decarboxylase [Desulfatiglandales bacterium]
MSNAKNLRSFIRLLEDSEELKRVDVEVHWKYEAGEVMHEYKERSRNSIEPLVFPNRPSCTPSL